MAGFENDICFALNADFSEADNQNPVEANGLASNGDLWIGTTIANIGGTHINVGTISSPLGTLTVGYSSPNITLDLAGGSTGIDSIAVDASTPPGTNPVLPTAGGQITMTGGQVANGIAGANVIRIQSLAANTVEVDIQRSETSAGSNSAVNGVAHFDSTDFSVDAAGFVELSTTGAGKTITGDSGGALSPISNNWNILGRSGSKTSGSGATLTINSPPYADVGVGGSVTLNSGSFATAAITLTTPVTAGLLDGDKLEFVATNGVLVIQLAATQVAHVGSAATTVAGLMTGTATGDALCMRYQASTNDWWTTSSIGVWVLS